MTAVYSQHRAIQRGAQDYSLSLNDFSYKIWENRDEIRLSLVIWGKIFIILRVSPISPIFVILKRNKENWKEMINIAGHVGMKTSISLLSQRSLSLFGNYTGYGCTEQYRA